MLRREFLVVSLGFVAACAPLPDTNPLGRDARKSLTISGIEVSTSGTAFESVCAADHSSALAPDLKAVLEREFSDRMAPGGLKLVVDVTRINLAGATTTAFGRDKSQMQGAVRLVDGNGTTVASYSIQVVVGDASGSTVGAIWNSVIKSADQYYRALVVGFARDTREQILGGELSGARLLRELSNS